jgi:hypothetical protein
MDAEKGTTITFKSKDTFGTIQNKMVAARYYKTSGREAKAGKKLERN